MSAWRLLAVGSAVALCLALGMPEGGDPVEVQRALSLRARSTQPPQPVAGFGLAKVAVTRAASRPKEEPKKEEPREEEPRSAGPAGVTTTAPHASTGSVVNAWIDNLLETGNRILELPLFMLLGLLGVLGGAAALVIGRLLRKERRARARRVILSVVAALLVFAVAWVVDRKIGRLQRELSELRSKMSAEAITLLTAVSTREAPRRSFLFDSEAAQDRLTKQFGQIRMRPLIFDEATDIVQVRRMQPIAQAYLAVVDLQHPGLEIRLGTTIKKKRLTSEFARENNCTVAINGEAGRSSGPDAGLGEWTGNLIDRGQVILLEDTNARPFLSFDRKNHAAYSPAAVVDRAVTPEKYNVFWGRHDALLEGRVLPADGENRQPRTAMAINRDGTRLYLLVVDGRQPDYSMGFTRAEVGQFLKAFGAHNGMLCDEGGSSCIYLSRFGGISNIPSDNRGQERPTYTHFGIALREARP